MAEQPTTLPPRMKRTLAHANELAQARGHDYLGTEHLLLALLDDPAGIAGLVIHRLGYAAAIRDEVIRIIESDRLRVELAGTGLRFDDLGRVEDQPQGFGGPRLGEG